MKTNKAKYPSDLSNEQWAILEPLIRAATRQPGIIDRRAIVNAIFYQLRTGWQWRYLPREYPKWKTVYSCFWRWQRSGVWDQVLAALQPIVRQSQGRKAYPTVAVIDSQRVKTTEKGGHGGLMGTKMVKGRKRFAACDIKGNLLESVVLPANIGERAGAWVLLERLKASPLGQVMALIRADKGFAGADWEVQVNAHFDWPVEIIHKPKDQVGFAVLPRRWVIEQTFGCWGR